MGKAESLARLRRSGGGKNSEFTCRTRQPPCDGVGGVGGKKTRGETPGLKAVWTTWPALNERWRPHPHCHPVMVWRNVGREADRVLKASGEGGVGGKETSGGRWGSFVVWGAQHSHSLKSTLRRFSFFLSCQDGSTPG